MSGRTKEQVHDQAMEVLDAIKGYKQKHGKMPTRREIKDMCSFNSWQTATFYVQKLEEMGYLTISKHKSRGISMISEEERQKALEEKEQEMYKASQEKKRKKRKPAILYPAAVAPKTNQQLITHVKVGETIEERRKEKEEQWMFVERTKKYRVMKIYPYIVLTQEIGTGIMRAFGYGDLIVMGLEYQSPELEARRYRTMDGRH